MYYKIVIFENNYVGCNLEVMIIYLYILIKIIIDIYFIFKYCTQELKQIIN